MEAQGSRCPGMQAQVRCAPPIIKEQDRKEQPDEDNGSKPGRNQMTGCLRFVQPRRFPCHIPILPPTISHPDVYTPNKSVIIHSERSVYPQHFLSWPGPRRSLLVRVGSLSSTCCTRRSPISRAAITTLFTTISPASIDSATYHNISSSSPRIRHRVWSSLSTHDSCADNPPDACSLSRSRRLDFSSEPDSSHRLDNSLKMASSYALPTSHLPHAHQTHFHSHTRSQSQASLHALRTSISNGSAPPRSDDEVYGHSPEHSHEHGDGSCNGHSHDHSGHKHRHSRSHMSNSSVMLARERMPPAPLNTLDGWTQERTPGGQSVITPGPETANTPYSPPDHHHDHHDHDHSHDHSHDHDHNHDHSHDHHGHDHAHTHSHDENNAKRSLFTRMILPHAARFPIIHAILIEKDSRRIFYFMALNFSFMAVQAFYGYVTDSLGLLSDSIHMFFDCVALMVGLLAAVLSKWPRSQRFPYGFGKIETLSGFANGILLMLLSVEIAFEAFERLWAGTETKRLGELFIVSTLGLLVNLVGMMAFGHHHHGHDHDHGHSHDQSHTHGGQACGGHSHSHDNENMHGIYLHILADTLGSASVIVSTVLTSFWGWAGWDPLASCLIAVLIFASSKPLVYSSAKRLLLSIPEDTEYNLRNSLGGILQQRGVVGYSSPKFWRDDHSASASGGKLLGIVHVVAARGAAMEDVRNRVREYLLKEGIDVVVQVEREGDSTCWCSRRGVAAPVATPTSLTAAKAF
ncbi:hypothetical protein FZEAL_1 [Fusarium zealandicum]|uniref:Zinc transporter n=1 Tax=Fusarium zealandicum TaxID=1053134 RepID=A0A8H4UVI8_9HYPO|nr:hypothetical protein FZEAL_1 [Fusarium zealandicum]